MTAEELKAAVRDYAELLAVEPDLHALMLATVRAWAERYAPEAKCVTLVGQFQGGLPDLVLTVPMRPCDEPSLLTS